MNKENEIIELESKVDFTLLDSRATENDLEKLCDIAYKHSYYSVCVNPCNVSYVRGYIDKHFNGEIKVVSVVGFPLGANSTEIKVQEAKEVFDKGADEIDFVVNIGMIKQGKFDYLKNEFKKIRKIAKKKIVKAIIETCYLDKNEIVKISKLCAVTKIDYVKTSTGFGTGGATLDDIKLIFDSVKGCCKVKASGGIRSRESAIDFVNAGASRIGTSHII
ncbi:MAG: deoxyribose-phosphate aldolase [Clostridia bacterium]|nr:deoxyribose-phosphate aldolase [Clostridia bacterium]